MINTIDSLVCDHKINYPPILIDVIFHQYRARKIPICIRRYMPDGSYEDWSIDELIIAEL